MWIKNHIWYLVSHNGIGMGPNQLGYWGIYSKKKVSVYMFKN